MNKEIIDIKSKKGLIDFLKQPTIKIAEFLTSFLASDVNDYKLSGGHLVQAFLKGNLFTQLGREIKKYVEEGKIKEDYFATNLNQQTLSELLKFIDTEVPDEERFKAIKSIFFTSVSKNSTKDDEILAYEFLQTAKKLSSTEILILKANFEIAQDKISEAVSKEQIANGKSHRNSWRRIIAQQMGFGSLDSIVIKYEENLESLGLISPRNVEEHFQGNFESTQKFRLTETGYKFCEFMTKYE